MSGDPSAIVNGTTAPSNRHKMRLIGRTQRRVASPQRIDLGQGKARMTASTVSAITSVVWRPWLEGRPLAAHNVGTERKFLRRAAPMHQLGPWIDTLKLARHVRPDLAVYSLSDVCEAMGLVARVREFCPGRDWHDALFDAFASALILEHCLAQPGWETVSIAALAHGIR